MHFILSFIAGITLYHTFQYFPFTAASLGIISSFYLFLRRKPILVLAMVLAISFASLKDCPEIGIPPLRQPTEIRCAFETYPEKTARGFLRQTAHIKAARNPLSGDSIQNLSGREVIILTDREFSLGKEYLLSVAFLKTGNRLNPGSYPNTTPYARLLAVMDERTSPSSLSGTVRSWRYRVYAFISERFQKDSGDFIASVSVGPLALLNSPVREAFNRTGLAHVLSISGTHFGLFSVVLFGMFRLLIQILPQPVLHRMTLYLSPAQAAAFFSFPFMVAYLGLSGGSIPAIRSFIMVGFFLFGIVISRRGLWLNSLILAAFFILLWDPNALFSLSFQLSFLAVAFIGVAIGKTDEDKERKSKIVRYIKNSVILTLAATAGTAPLVAYSFHYTSLISPVTNLVIAPLIGFILIPLSVIAAFIFLLTGYYPFAPVLEIVSEKSIALVQKFSHLPYASLKIPAFPPVILVLFYGGVVLYFLCQKKKVFLLVPLISVLFYSLLPISGTDRIVVTFLDVGQGDAAVAELPDGKILVIDTGTTGREVASFLEYRGRKDIDALVLSHIHPDHTGGMRYLDQKFDINEIWHSGRLSLPDDLRTSRHRMLQRGDGIEGKGYDISVFHPYPEFYTMQANEHVAANNDSLVLRIADRNGSFLFAGDVESEAEEDMYALGGWLASDVVKVPHHGGRTSAYQPFIDAVNARIAVISSGRDNPFGHPHQEMLDVLSGKLVLRTDTDGAIRIEKTVHGYDIRRYADFRFEKTDGIGGEIRNIRRLFRTW